MAANIKGLTVEIGGDTTKLGKALEDVNKKSRDLSSELGQINKLLKLDPGNADLLAQKQKVLADAIDNTAEKLKTLKEAEKQVQKQFEKGEVSEEQVRALQREIIATEKKMESYKKATKETEKALRGLGDETEKTEKSSGKLGKALASAAKGGVTALAAGVTAAIGAMVASAEATREYRTEMGKLETGFDAVGYGAETAAETYKTLQGVIGETDQSVEAAQQIALLAQSEQDVAKWADLAAGVVGRFGDALQPETFYEAANETLKLGEATGAYTQLLEGTGYSVEEFNAGLAACVTEEEKQAYMLGITQQLLGDAAEKYRETNAEIIRANEANEAWTSSMAEVGGAIEPILTDVKLLGASLVSDLVPGVKGVAEAFRGVLSGDEGAASDLGTALSGIFTQILTKITEMLPQLVTAAMSLITTLTTTLISMLPQLVSTGAQMVLSIITGLTQALPQIITALSQMIPQLMMTLQTFLPQIITGIVSLVTTLASQLPQILPPLIESLPGLIMAVVNSLLENLPVLLQGVISMVSALVEQAPAIISAILPLIPQIITAVCDMIAENAPVLLTALLELVWMLVSDVLPEILLQLATMLPQILESVVSGIGKIWDSLSEWYDNLISNIAAWLTNVLDKVKTWLGDMISRAASGASDFVTSIVDFFAQLPGKIWTWLQNAINKVVEFGTNAVTKAKTAAKNIFDAIINGIKELPSKVLSIGSDLVRGLWNGINDMTSWVIGKIQGFGDSVLGGIKSFFGIKSPSRVFKNEIGAMLAEGLAEGIEDNADAPLDAMAGLSDDLLDEAGQLNGLTLQRKLENTFAAPDGFSSAELGLFDRLDRILTAIERGQILTIDGKTWVGATADLTDSALGLRRSLVARGAV